MGACVAGVKTCTQARQGQIDMRKQGVCMPDRFCLNWSSMIASLWESFTAPYHCVLLDSEAHLLPVRSPQTQALRTLCCDAQRASFPLACRRTSQAPFMDGRACQACSGGTTSAGWLRRRRRRRRLGSDHVPLAALTGLARHASPLNQSNSCFAVARLTLAHPAEMHVSNGWGVGLQVLLQQSSLRILYFCHHSFVLFPFSCRQRSTTTRLALIAFVNLQGALWLSYCLSMRVRGHWQSSRGAPAACPPLKDDPPASIFSLHMCYCHDSGAAAMRLDRMWR
jgi:hypothetical protein